MNLLVGTYKSKFGNFSLKIESSIDPEFPDKHTFTKIEPDGSETVLFESILEGGKPGTQLILGIGLSINHNIDFTMISIKKSPIIGLQGNYIKVK